MDVFDGIRTMLAVRRYKDTPVPDATVRRIVEAGRLTASAMNAQPWHFVVVQDRPTLRRLGTLARTGSYVKTKFAVSDASRAIQSMLLAAWADGVGSNWTGLTGLENVRQEFGLPDTYDVLAVIPFGYPKRKVIGKKKRNPFDQVVSAERFGSPLG